MSDKTVAVVMLAGVLIGGTGLAIYLLSKSKSKSSASANATQSGYQPPDEQGTKRPEVYNIRLTSGNGYGPPEAFTSALRAIGARLATKQEVDQSYRDGGFWCSYGYTDESGASNCYYLTHGESGCQGNTSGPTGGPDDPYTKGKNCALNAYGIKPAKTHQFGDILIMPFNSSKWSQWD